MAQTPILNTEILAKQEVIPEKGHNEVVTPDIKPGVSTPGYTGGTHCDVCGAVLTQPESVPATGIWVNAVLSETGILTVSGALSYNAVAEGTTFLSVYAKNNRMLSLVNITAKDQSDFSISIENMKDAHTVKVLRWVMPSLRPLHNAVEVNVTSK